MGGGGRDGRGHTLFPFAAPLCVSSVSGGGGTAGVSDPGCSQLDRPQNKWWSLGWNSEGGGGVDEAQ